jgi:hypothetical protein
VSVRRATRVLRISSAAATAAVINWRIVAS